MKEILSLQRMGMLGAVKRRFLLLTILILLTVLSCFIFYHNAKSFRPGLLKNQETVVSVIDLYGDSISSTDTFSSPLDERKWLLLLPALHKQNRLKYRRRYQGRFNAD